MVKKFMAGLMVSAGAGLAVAATTLAIKKERRKRTWGPAKSEGIMTPLTLRVDAPVPRNEEIHIECEDEPVKMTVSPGASAEVAEMRSALEGIEQRANEMIGAVNQRIDDLQSHLPRFIDIKVTCRLREVEERLRIEFRDEQSRTVDAFLQTLEQKVLPRIAAVEQTLGAQRDELSRMRMHQDKTDARLDAIVEHLEKVMAVITPPPGLPLNGHAGSYLTELHQKAVA